MNTDVMHLLSEADPVASEPHYDDAQAQLRIDAIIAASATPPDAADATVIALVDRPSEVVRRRWVVAAGAAVTVAALAAAGLTIVQKHRSGVGVGAPTISCRVAGIASTARMLAARTVITDRVAAAGGHAVSFRLDGRTIGFTARGVDSRTAATACGPTSAALRPLVTAPVPANTTGPHSATPLAGLGFDVPRSATQLAALSPPQHSRLLTAMARYDCTAVAPLAPSAPALACGQSTGRHLVYLLGPAVVTSSAVSSAAAQAPTPTGDAQWAVRLTFTAKGQAAVADYTGQHHTTRPLGSETTCSAPTSPCADFLASVINNRVESAAQVNGTVLGTMDTTGGFDRSSATTLADNLTAATVGLAPVLR